MTEILKNVKQFIRPGRRYFILSIILSILDVIFLSYYPFLLTWVIDNYLKLKTEDIIWILFTFTLSIVLTLLVQYLNKIVKNKYELMVKKNLRNEMFKSISHMEFETFSTHRIEDYMSLIVNDLNDLYSLLFENLIYNVNSIIMLVTYTIILLFFSWQMCLTIMGSLIFVFVLPLITGKKFDALSKDFADSRANYMSKTEEYLKAHQIFNKNNIRRIMDLHGHTLNDMQSKNQNLSDYRSGVQVISGASLYIQLVICFTVGIILVLNGVISIGVFASALIYVEYVSSYSSNIIDEILEMKSSKEYLDRINSVLNKKNRFERKPNGTYLYSEESNVIKLKNIGYSSSGKILLNPVSVNINLSEKYLIIGENGSGKSTLIKIIAGLLNPTMGQLVFPQNFEYTEENITYIPQDRLLFEGSILQNILFFKDVSNDELSYVKELSKSLRLNLDLNTWVKKSGANLSGGEKAKICLIRGLINKSKLILIDEPLNDADISSQNDILKTILNLDCCVVLISHGVDEGLVNHIIRLTK